MSRAIKTLLYLGLVTGCIALGYAIQVAHTKVLQHAFIGGLIALGLFLVVLAAFDVSQLFGGRAREWFVQGGAPIHSAPEFERAQQLRASGQPLEAINVLREFLQNHPGEFHVMSRIAEIYNYDLKNYLAAALEYEEFLKHKPEPEQWGWAALHLAKLYGRLNEPEKSLALLERLETKYGHTVAGRRARKALEQLDEPGTQEAESP